MEDGLSDRIRQLERELDALPEPRRTWFLEPDRATTPRLAAQIALASSSPILAAILSTGAGAMAVLNDRRQVIALNDAWLELVGGDGPGSAVGLRPGEAFHCVHASGEAPAGCGTSMACRTCGVAISLYAAIEGEGAAERDCALTLERNGTQLDRQLHVRAQPLEVGEERFVLLSLVDVSAERRRAALERAVFHDLGDLLTAIVAACDAMEGEDDGAVTVAAADAREVAAQLGSELKLQRALLAPIPTGYDPTYLPVPLGGIVDALRTIFVHHPVAAGRRLRVTGDPWEAVVETDPHLLTRVLSHMLVNAFEATPPRGEVALRLDVDAREATFRVWNPGVIPPAVAPRIFQRYFTTHPEPGRGQGTFVMKFFTERVLHGRIGFISSAEAGTTFELRIPRAVRH